MLEKKNILVVDDEEDITLSVVNYLKKHLTDLNVFAAFDGNKALEMIKSNRIDLLITDIRMPGVNGIDLLLELKKKNPEAGAIVITAYGSETIKKRSEDAGALYYLEKPFKLSHLYAVVKKYLSEEEGFKGNVSKLDLVDILQMVCLNRKSMLVEIKQNNKLGKVYIQNGEIIHCQCESKEGKEACFEILSWKNGEFNLLPFTEFAKIKRTINESYMTLFMEGLKRVDEVNLNGESSKTSQLKLKISEIINSVFNKIEDLETNVVINIDKKKVVFNGEFTEEEFSMPKARDYSFIIEKLSESVLKNETEELSEVLIILENSFLLFMKLSKNLVWCVKIKDVQKVGVAKIALEKAKNELKKVIEEATS